jgi:hypothetical protein
MGVEATAVAGIGVEDSGSVAGEAVSVGVPVAGGIVGVRVALGGGGDAEGVGCAVGRSVRQATVKIRIKSTMKTRRMAVL